MINSNVFPVADRFSQTKLRDLIAQYVSPARIPNSFNIFTDTSDFFRIEYNDVVILDDQPYLIRNNKREGRFGVDGQPKFWVKSAIDLTTGEQKIMKMVFHEQFMSKVGDVALSCFRSPKKEARILNLVKGHSHFMQGYSTRDSEGNIIRILDYIGGKTLAEYILALGKNHEEYFFNYFPSLLDDYIDLVHAIKFLHDKMEVHGDIRRDHIIRDKTNGLYRWIDFDFNFIRRESMYQYDLFGLGNIIIYLTGQGDITTQDLKKNKPSIFNHICYSDLNIIFHNRVANLQKIYPYIPDELIFILMNFSTEANIFYDDASQLLDDLYGARAAIC